MTSRIMAGIVRKIVNSAKAPAPVGPYNQAIVVDRTMYLSGQIGLDPKTGNLVPGGTIPEADQALKNIGAVLEEVGITYNNVVRVTVLLADINDFAAVNEVYTKYSCSRKKQFLTLIYNKVLDIREDDYYLTSTNIDFTSKYPARAAYQVAALPKNAKIEIEAVAIVDTIVDA